MRKYNGRKYDGRVWLCDTGSDGVNIVDADTLEPVSLEELVDRHNVLVDQLDYLDDLHGDST